MRAANDAQLAALEAAAGRCRARPGNAPSCRRHLDRRALGGRRTALVVDRLGRAAGRRLRPGGALTRTDADAWRAADLAAGIPWIGAATQDLFIPQTVNLELIQGVSFTKGCYPGQEVVARSHYRGTVKRRMAYGASRRAPRKARWRTSMCMTPRSRTNPWAA